MKIRTQFILTLCLFGLILIVMTVSLLLTQQQADRLYQQEEIAHRIEQGAIELSHLSGDYLVYGESQQRARWESSFASFSEDVSKLKPANPGQQARADHIKVDQARLKAIFTNVVSTLEKSAQTSGGVPDPAFRQVSWSRMEVQNRGIAFESSLLTQQLRVQADLLRQRNLLFIFVLIGIFGAYLVTSYYLIDRRTLRSIAALQTGTAIIGSGNLDFTIAVQRADEIGDLSRAFNRMTASLKEVTASKADLEREIAERERAEAALRALNDELEQRVAEQYAEILAANKSLEQRVAARTVELQAANDTLRASRLAALNLIEDITQAQEQVVRLNRTLKALSNSNQAMMRAGSEQEYLNEVCRIIVEDCGHAMVWIGYAEEDDRQSVRPVASAGFEAGYLETLAITWAETERGCGPAGTAIRTGKPSRCRNMQTDPEFAPWREEALKRGYASTITFPLLIEGRAIGNLSIYSREPDSFSEAEEQLITELAGDLAYGINAIRLQAAHARAEVALRASEARYRALFDNMTEGFALHEIVCDADGHVCDYRFIEINPSFERLTGLKRDEIIGQLVSKVLPELEPRWIETYGEVAHTGQPIHFDNYSAGLGRHYEVYAYCPIPNQFAVLFMDITERKQAEEAVQRVQVERAEAMQQRATLEERQRLARELHDSVSQALYGISLGVHTAMTLLETDRDKVREALKYTLSLTTAGLTEMRALIFELRPESLEQEGLVAALTKQTDAIRVRYGIEVVLSVCDEPDLPLAIKEALYRIAQEALQNAIKHAQGDRLEVNLVCEATGLWLEVCDNGVGFEPMASFPGHLGLRSMRERALRMGGELRIISAPGCGTQLRAYIPIPVPPLGPD